MSAQAMAALERANEVRFARAALKARLRSGEVSLVELLEAEESPDWLRGMKVIELLSSRPGWGKKTAVKVLRGLGISEVERWGALRLRDRYALVDALEGRL